MISDCPTSYSYPFRKRHSSTAQKESSLPAHMINAVFLLFNKSHQTMLFGSLVSVEQLMETERKRNYPLQVSSFQIRF